MVVEDTRDDSVAEEQPGPQYTVGTPQDAASSCRGSPMEWPPR